MKVTVSSSPQTVNAARFTKIEDGISYSLDVTKDENSFFIDGKAVRMISVNNEGQNVFATLFQVVGNESVLNSLSGYFDAAGFLGSARKTYEVSRMQRTIDEMEE